MRTERPGSASGTAAKRRRNFWIAAAAIAVLAAVLFALHRRGEVTAPETAKAEAVKPRGFILATPEQLKEIRVEPAREQTVDMNLEATGKVDFNEDRLTPVLPAYPGRVAELFANRGDSVRASQPLLVIESPDLVAAVNDLIGAHSAVDRAQTALDAAQKSAERARRLHAQEALSTKDLQAAESELAQVQQDFSRAQSSLQVDRNRLALLGKSAQEIEQIENSYKNPRSTEIDRRIVIRAPIAGTVVDRKVGLGQYIKPDSPDPLYLIGDLSSVWITFDIYDKDLSRIHLGAPVEISLVGYPGRSFSSRISSISPTVDPATRAVKVRSVVPNPDGLFKPEMFARVRVGEAFKQKVVTVPSTAILTEGERSFVLVEESSGRFSRAEVQTGDEIDGNTTVERGLQMNARVVTSGVLLLSSSEGAKP
jgi:cobalt-zinc-cadmium efflux system membrane fusion protein